MNMRKSVVCLFAAAVLLAAPRFAASHADDYQLKIKKWVSQIPGAVYYPADAAENDGWRMSRELCGAVKSGDMTRAEKMLADGADPNAAGDFGLPPIFCAAKNANIDMAKLLVRHGANVNVYGELHGTVLHVLEEIFLAEFFAADGLQYDAFNEFILNSGFNPDLNAVPVKFHYANDYRLEVKERVSKIPGAVYYPADAVENDGWCMSRELCGAVESGDMARAKKMLADGADPNTAGDFGVPPIFCAAKNADTGMAKLLVRHGANVNVYNELYGTAWHVLYDAPLEIGLVRRATFHTFLLDSGLRPELKDIFTPKFTALVSRIRAKEIAEEDIRDIDEGRFKYHVLEQNIKNSSK